MRTVLSHKLHRVKTSSEELNKYVGSDMAGAFVVLLAGGEVLRVVSSGPASYEGSHGWEHVSVSLENRIPSWEEMCLAKDLFWFEDETVIQFHPPKAEYINHHPNVLHLWKAPYQCKLPPRSFV